MKTAMVVAGVLLLVVGGTEMLHLAAVSGVERLVRLACSLAVLGAGFALAHLGAPAWVWPQIAPGKGEG